MAGGVAANGDVRRPFAWGGCAVACWRLPPVCRAELVTPTLDIRNVQPAAVVSCRCRKLLLLFETGEQPVKVGAGEAPAERDRGLLVAALEAQQPLLDL